MEKELITLIKWINVKRIVHFCGFIWNFSIISVFKQHIVTLTEIQFSMDIIWIKNCWNRQNQPIFLFKRKINDKFVLGELIHLLIDWGCFFFLLLFLLYFSPLLDNKFNVGFHQGFFLLWNNIFPIFIFFLYYISIW